MAVVTTNLGVVTAYGDAVAAGYTGTKAEWQELMASYATVAEEAAQSATDAETAKDAAVTAKTAAETAKTDAIAAKTAAQTAQTAAETAQGAAEDAAQDAEDSAESIAASASQIAQNTSDIEDLKEDLQNVPTVKTPDDATEADLYICDDNGNVIAKFEDGHVKTKNFDSSDIDFGEIESDIEDLKSATSGILFRNMDATDGVYASCRWHQPNASSKQFCLLMGGDIHGDTVRMNSMVEYLNAIDAFDAGIMLGDIGGSTFADDIAFYTNAIANSNKPFLTVIGNHDSGGHTSEAELCAKYITPNIGYADLVSGEYVSGNTYYYKDFPTYGIRLIVLNQYNYPDGAIDYSVGDGCFGQAEIDWFVQTLKNTPSDYGVIIATHTWPGAMATETNSLLSSSTTGAYTPHIILSDRNIILKIVDAWIKGATLTETYTYTEEFGWTSLAVDADFTSRGSGEFITYIGGHWHMSLLAHGYAYTNQMSYTVDCSGLSASRQGDTPRREGTRSEDCICALSVDRDLKKVKIFRIGAHFTKDAVDRLYGVYGYGGQA